MTTLDPLDTIAAIASPPGPGLRGLVRVTGPDAWSVASGGFVASDGRTNPPTRPERRIGALTIAGLRRAIPAALGFWPGSKTYTGQPLAEIHATGSPPILRLLLADCLTRGCRLAEPGEFTLRAFLSGRIDLTQSEAVLGVIEARTASQLDEALRQLAGGLAAPIQGLRDRLADVLAHLEANLDFSEEPDVDPLGVEALARSLDEAASEIERMASRLRGRDRPGDLYRVVLVGPPNAGKSRLFNALLGLDRAIVSPVSGTTRDYLEAPCDADGLAIVLVDTAGQEDGNGLIEGQAQAARGRQVETADLLVDCRSRDPGPVEIGTRTLERPRLQVWTKADVARPIDPTGLLVTSASTGEGLGELRRAVAVSLRARLDESGGASGTADRCGEGLARAGQSLQAAAETLRRSGGDELVALDLRQALDDLGRVVGAVVTDDLLDRIFRRFCIGK